MEKENFDKELELGPPAEIEEAPAGSSQKKEQEKKKKKKKKEKKEQKLPARKLSVLLLGDKSIPATPVSSEPTFKRRSEPISSKRIHKRRRRVPFFRISKKHRTSRYEDHSKTAEVDEFEEVEINGNKKETEEEKRLRKGKTKVTEEEIKKETEEEKMLRKGKTKVTQVVEQMSPTYYYNRYMELVQQEKALNMAEKRIPPGPGLDETFNILNEQLKIQEDWMELLKGDLRDRVKKVEELAKVYHKMEKQLDGLKKYNQLCKISFALSIKASIRLRGRSIWKHIENEIDEYHRMWLKKGEEGEEDAISKYKTARSLTNEALGYPKFLNLLEKLGNEIDEVDIGFGHRWKLFLERFHERSDRPTFGEIVAAIRYLKDILVEEE